MNRAMLIAAMSAMMTQGVAAAEIYKDKTSFLANMKTGYWLEEFNGVPNLTFVQEINLSGNGYVFKVTAPTGFFQPTDIISANEIKDAITITITQGTVTAIGGNFWGTDFNFVPVPTQITVKLSDGSQEVFNTNSSTEFRGFTSTIPITSITFDADDTAEVAWATMDNLYLGEAGAGPCYPDCDGTGALTIDDFICFQTRFVIGDLFADCDLSGSLAIDDFICFQTFFVLGC